MGLDDLFKQQQEQAQNNKEGKDPLLAEQGYVTGYDAVTGLQGLSSNDAAKGTLGDTSYFDEGRILLNESVDRARADKQSTFQKWGNSALKILPSIALGIAETAGYMLDMENLGSLFTGAKTNYDNAFSQYMRDTRESLDESLAVYQRNPGAAFDLGDAGWWANNTTGLIESIAEFYLLGAATGGTAGAVSLAAKGARGLSMARKAKMLKNLGILSPDKLVKAQANLARAENAVNFWNTAAQ